MAFILKELAGADKLRAMKLALAPNNNKANAVSKIGLSYAVQMTAGTESQATQTQQATMGRTAHRRKF